MGLDNKPWVRRADGTFGYYVSDNSSYDYSKEGTVLGENFTYSADNGDMVELQPGGSWSSSASNETHQAGVNFIAASHIYVDHSADWLAFSEQARALRKLMDKTLVEVAIWVGPSLVFAPSTVILRGAAMYDVVACEVATCAAERQAVVVVGEVAAEVAAKGGSSWVYGAFKTEAKWAAQLSKRGWTAEQITEAVTKGKSFDAMNMVNKANSATRYVHPTTGQSVVIDDLTKELLHVGGPGFKY
jgi:hypothetical protein